MNHLNLIPRGVGPLKPGIQPWPTLVWVKDMAKDVGRLRIIVYVLGVETPVEALDCFGHYWPIARHPTQSEIDAVVTDDYELPEIADYDHV